MNSPDDSIAPDIETASAGYQARFEGPVGEYFLDAQADAVLSLLPAADTSGPLKVLEIGGGHAQLTRHFLSAGHEVWVQGSNEAALARIRRLEREFKGGLHAFTSPINSVPFNDSFFDVVAAVRLAAHVPKLGDALREWTRLARRRVIFDYPPLESFNVLYPVLFRMKKLFEKNTRHFEIYPSSAVKSELEKLGWKIAAENRQFFFPMVVHRALKNVPLSVKFENFAATLRLTSAAGSPAVVAAERVLPPFSQEAF